jgi:hypothetical protein
MTTQKKINKYLKIENNKVYAKTKLRITLNPEEYKTLDEDGEYQTDIEEIDTVFNIPGFFTLEAIEDNDSIQFFFPYEVFINKTDDTEISKDLISIPFEEGDLVFYATFSEEGTDMRVIKSLFENGVKYLGNYPDKLIYETWQQLNKAITVPLHHIEIIFSQLYGAYSKKYKRVVPLRLTGLPYSKKYIMNIKESVQQMNNSLGFAYGYSNDALRTAVSQKTKKENSFFEDIIAGDYDSMIKKTKRD